VLKLLDKDSIELRILEFLNNIKSDVNHVISVLDSIRLDIGTVIAFPIASPLGCPDFTKFSVTLDLMHQLMKQSPSYMQIGLRILI